MKTTIVLAALLFGAFATPSVAQNVHTSGRLPLDVGDRLAFSFSGGPWQGDVVPIDSDGTITMPFIGTLPAAGLSLSELRNAVALRMIESEASIVLSDGSITQVSLAGSKIFLRVDARAPIVVGGAVRRPGTVAFRVGMTVNEAIALAGGLDTGFSANASPLQISQVKTQLDEALTWRAEILVTLWTSSALLNADPDYPEPKTPSGIEPDTFKALVQHARLSVMAHLSELDAAIANANEQIALLRARSENLRLQINVIEDERGLARSETERLSALRERGLLPAQQIVIAQRNLNDADESYFEAQGALATLELEVLRAKQAMADSRAALNRLALDMRSRALADRVNAERKIQTLNLVALGLGPIVADDLPSNIASVKIRRDGKILAKHEESLQAILKPGDFIHVNFEAGEM